MGLRTTRQQLLAGTSAIALVAVFASPAYAAWSPSGSVSGASASQYSDTGGTNDTLAVTDGGNITDSTSNSAVTDNGTGAVISVTESADTTKGIVNTGNFSAISTTDTSGVATAGTISSINVNGGTISSKATGASSGTVALVSSAGGGETTNITLGTNSTITNANTGATGNAIYINDTGAAANDTINNNGGTISILSTNTGGSAIYVGSTSKNNAVAINNNSGGTITGGAATNNAITFTGTGNSSVTQSGSSSQIVGKINMGNGANTFVHINGGSTTGAINFGTGATQNLTIGSGATVNGAVTTGAANQTITLSGGQLNGTIDGTASGQGKITLSAGNTGTGNSTYVANGAIGGTTAVNNLTVNDGLIFSTTGVINSANGVILGSSTAGSTLTVGGGSITGGIQGSTGNAGTGTVNFTQDQTMGAGGLGTTTKLATINITDNKTVDDSANTTGISANHIYLGTTTASTNIATLKVGTGAFNAVIDSKTIGTGSLTFTGSNTLGSGAIIGGTSSLGTVNINDGAVVNASSAGAIKATSIVLGSTNGTGTLTLGTSTVTGTIESLSGKAGTGTVNLTAANTLGGDIGTATRGVATVAITNGSAITANAHNIVATNITLDSGSSLSLTSGVVTGAIDGAGNNQGTVNFDATQTTAGAVGGAHNLAAVNINAGTVSLGETTGDTIKANVTTVNTGGTLNFGNTSHTIDGDLTGAGTGTINLGTKAQTLAAGDHGTGTGALTTAAGGETIGVTVNSGTANDNGNITTAGNVTIDTNTKIAVNVASTAGYVASGTTYKWLTTTGTNGSNALVDANVSSNDMFLTFSESKDSTTRTLTATRANTYNSMASSENNANVGTVLESLGAANTSDPQLQAALSAAESSGSSTALNNTLKQYTIQPNGTSVQAISDSTQSLNVVSTRLEQLRADNDTSIEGMAAGGRTADTGLWFQGFGTAATQSLRDGVDGYDATTVGGAAGIDTAIDNQDRIGISGSYARSNVDSNGSADQTTDINSYQGNVYGSRNVGNWYADGMLGFAYQQYSTDRHITASSAIAGGDFNGETYTARTNTGYRIRAGNGFDITPNAGLTYFFNHVSAYTETGAGGADLNVKGTNTQALYSRVGTDFGYDMHSGGTLIRPVLRAGYSYDLIGDQFETTSNFTGGGAAFKTRDASPERNAWDLGASLNIVSRQNLTLSADYDYLGKSGYDSQSGVLRARYNF